MRFCLDSNILLYSLDRDAGTKRTVARDILLQSRFLDCVLAAQVLGEVMAVVRRKQPDGAIDAADFVDRCALLFPTIPTTVDHIRRAADLAERYKLQFWDSVIIAVALETEAGALLSEDSRTV